MFDDRTQPASKRRKQLARERGQVAHSPELTASIGWVVAVATLGALGDKLTLAFTSLIGRAVAVPALVSVDQITAVAQIREQFAVVVWPVLTVLAAYATGAFAAHQVQVRGLWATQLIVPDPARLWLYSRRHGISLSVERTLWALVKTACVVIASVLAVRAAWGDVLRLGGLEGGALVRAAGQVWIRAAWILAGVLLILGLLDYAIRCRRFEITLRTTPHQEREDQRVMQGDPAARAQRFRVARARRSDSIDVLSGASLLLTGVAGLTVVLAGGPPPRRVSVRTSVKGNVGLRFRRLAEANNIPRVEAPDLARRLARRPADDSSITAKLIADLSSIWPIT
jgi:flagellar biosynthesis protein FlhB